MSTKLRLLVLSVGSLAAQNVIDALVTRRERCVLIGTNSVAEAAGNFRCDSIYLVPPAAAGTAYIARLDEVIREERPDIVIPSRDDDVLALAILGEQSPRTHPALLTGTAATARLWLDKTETARFAARHDLPFAPTAVNVREAVEFARSYGLPLIGKPRAGNGSRGVVLLRSTEEIAKAFKSDPDLIAQPYLGPPADIHELIAPMDAGLPFFFSFPDSTQYIITVVVGPDGALSEPFGWRGRLVGGQSVEGHRCDDPDLLEVSRAYARAAAAEGWRGPLNVQLRRERDGKLAAFELNGRFGGGTAARTCFGFDEVGEAVRRFLPTAAFPSVSARGSDAVQKYPHSYPVPRAAVALLRASGRCSFKGEQAHPDSGAAATQSQLRLLLLSCGSLVAQNVIDALGTRRERCVLIGANSVAEAAGNFRCDTVYMVPPAASSAAHLDRVAGLIGDEQPDLVIPCRDDDVLALAMLRERLSGTGAVLLTGSAAAAQIMNDKLETARFAMRHELPFAPTAENVHEALNLAATHGLPLIGKPRFGYGSHGVCVLRSAAEIERAFESRRDLIVQPFLDPPSNLHELIAPMDAGLPYFFSFPEDSQHTVQLLVTPDGRIFNQFGGLNMQIAGRSMQEQAMR